MAAGSTSTSPSASLSFLFLFLLLLLLPTPSLCQSPSPSQPDSPSPSPSPSSSSSSPHAFTSSTSASSSSSQQSSSIMQYNTGPHIAASSGFSQGNNSKTIHDQFQAQQQQWLNQYTHNSIHKAGVPRSSSCLSSITTSKQTNSNSNIPTNSGNGFLASWSVDMDRNRL